MLAGRAYEARREQVMGLSGRQARHQRLAAKTAVRTQHTPPLPPNTPGSLTLSLASVSVPVSVSASLSLSHTHEGVAWVAKAVMSLFWTRRSTSQERKVAPQIGIVRSGVKVRVASGGGAPVDQTWHTQDIHSHILVLAWPFFRQKSPNPTLFPLDSRKVKVVCVGWREIGR